MHHEARKLRTIIKLNLAQVVHVRLEVVLVVEPERIGRLLDVQDGALLLKVAMILLVVDESVHAIMGTNHYGLPPSIGIQSFFERDGFDWGPGCILGRRAWQCSLMLKLIGASMLLELVL